MRLDLKAIMEKGHSKSSVKSISNLKPDDETVQFSEEEEDFRVPSE